MKISTLSVSLAALSILAFANPKLNDAEKKALNVIQPSNLEPHLRFLADDYLEGRESGKRGNEIAARYIASQFQKFGLKPAGENGSYFQQVRLLEKTITPESNIQIEGTTLSYGADFYSVGGAADLKGELMYVKFAITAPEYEYDDLKDVDVNGKIVVFLSGEPASTDSAYFLGGADSPHSSTRRKVKKLESMGAAGVIQLLMPPDDVDFGQFEEWLRHPRVGLATDAAGGQLFPRMICTPAGSEKFLASFGLKRPDVFANPSKGTVFNSKKTSVSIKVEQKERAFQSPNVIGLLEGADPKLKSEVVILTAHFDHVGIGRAVDGDSIYNGLSDNASGTGILLNTAEAFCSLKGKVRRSVAFMACTAEEMGLLGSKYFTENPTLPIESIVADINFDVMGVANEKTKRTITLTGEEFTTLGETMHKWSEYVGVKVTPDLFPEERFFFRSDNLNFHLKKIPSISPSSGMTSRSDFDDYLKYYHQPGDEWGKLPMDLEALKLQAQVIFLSALDVANTESRPQFKPAP
ncbi:MAG: M28 family peptidase [Bacteroidetes bacterium]|nr:M28 family peptidase [Bacteroidota bacterium]